MSISVGDILKGYLYESVTKLTEMDFFNRTVQYDNDSNNVATSEATFLFVGPPVLNPANKQWNNSPLAVNGSGQAQNLGGIAQYMKPLGAVQQYALQSGRQVIPFPELGSILKRHAVGSGQYSASLSRIETRSTNLKASLYSWLPGFLKGTGLATSLPVEIDLAFPPATVMTDKSGRYWEHYQWIGMDSELLRVPFGMLAITGAADGRAIHMEYLERCYLPNYSKGYSAGNPMVVANANIMVTRPVPFTDSNNNSLIPKELLLKKNKVSAFKLSEFKAA